MKPSRGDAPDARAKRARGRALAGALLLVTPAVALAQGPTLPSIPTIPSGLPAIPSAPIPSLPAMPSGLPWAMPSGVPSGLPAVPRFPGKKGAGDGSDGNTPPPSGAGTKLAGPPVDLELRREDNAEKPEKEVAERSSKLPPALRPKDTEGGLRVQERGNRSVTIEEVVDREVTSVSKRAEGSRAAPAWVITITGKELRDRGYGNLSEILDDLPGIDVARPYGQPYVRAYWRGSRPNRGADGYVVLLDGMP